MKPAGLEVAASDQQKATMTALFASREKKASLCSEVGMEQFGDDPAKTLGAYRRSGNTALSALADQVSGLESESQRNILKAVEDVLCDQAE